MDYYELAHRIILGENPALPGDVPRLAQTLYNVLSKGHDEMLYNTVKYIQQLDRRAQDVLMNKIVQDEWAQHVLACQ